jgi:ferredoxin
MADVSDKLPQNVPGKYYVDSSCIACELCTSLASANFKMLDDNSYAYVSQQPASPDEIKACEDALSQCPVEAIGNDG